MYHLKVLPIGFVVKRLAVGWKFSMLYQKIYVQQLKILDAMYHALSVAVQLMVSGYLMMPTIPGVVLVTKLVHCLTDLRF
ncbi:hypothetical protein ABT56_19095 [Photobacterium aquae]|uniref:Uncharacterized protein n=1 Tax=Photobacterium aquae TaxID=1195763 RepID=A0A0J1GV86_9GAMM|nr:hypothetical protein ABT56_19095 [Photobacterium aquae]